MAKIKNLNFLETLLARLKLEIEYYLDSTPMTIHKTIKSTQSVKQNFIFITCLMFMTVTKNKISSLV